MIDRELLDNVTHVVTHSSCPDGVASAILLTDALADVKITFLTHGTDPYEKLIAEPGMLFCDLAPPRERVQEFVDVGAIVLDHHAAQRDIVEAFGPRGIFADLVTEPGVSGALLAFRHVWQHITSEGSPAFNRALHFAEVAGVRDTWQRNDKRWPEARAQAEALRFYPWSFFEKLVREGSTFGDHGSKQLASMLDIGPVLVERVDLATKRLVEDAYGAITHIGTRLLIVGSRQTSDVTDVTDADIVIGFEYHGGEKCTLELSMRSRTHDVGAFCKSLGGGGHRGAAGARIPVTNGDLNPYSTITKLVEDYERQ